MKIVFSENRTSHHPCVPQVKMSKKETNYYAQLLQKVQLCHRDLMTKSQQEKCNVLWKSTFTNYSKREEFDEVKYNKIIKNLSKKIDGRKSMFDRFIKKDKQKQNAKSKPKDNHNHNNHNKSPPKPPPKQKPEAGSQRAPKPLQRKRVTPADEEEQLLVPDNENCTKQIEIIDRIKMNNVYLNQLRTNNSVQLPTAAILQNKTNIKKTLIKINQNTKKLKALKSQRKSSKKRRTNRNKLVKQCKEALGDEADWINIKEKPGRPRFVDTAKGKNYFNYKHIHILILILFLF